MKDKVYYEKTIGSSPDRQTMETQLQTKNLANAKYGTKLPLALGAIVRYGKKEVWTDKVETELDKFCLF